MFEAWKMEDLDDLFDDFLDDLDDDFWDDLDDDFASHESGLWRQKTWEMGCALRIFEA